MPLVGDRVTIAVCSDITVAVTSHLVISTATRKLTLNNQINIAWKNPVLNTVLPGLSSNSVPGRWIPNRPGSYHSWWLISPTTQILHKLRHFHWNCRSCRPLSCMTCNSNGSVDRILLSWGQQYPIDYILLSHWEEEDQHTLRLEWPHRQGGCLACWRLQLARSNPGCDRAAPIYTSLCMRHSVVGWYCPWGWGVQPVNWNYHLWRHCP